MFFYSIDVCVCMRMCVCACVCACVFSSVCSPALHSLKLPLSWPSQVEVGVAGPVPVTQVSSLPLVSSHFLCIHMVMDPG